MMPVILISGSFVVQNGMDRIRLIRRITQIGFLILLFCLPIFDILRYDVATKELFIFRNVWSLGLPEGFFADRSIGGAGHVAVQFLLNAILPWVAVLSIFPLLGALLGRFFCGWFCPEGALFELADFLTMGMLGKRNPFGRGRVAPHPGRRLPYALAALGALVVVPPVFALGFAGYFIAPATVWQQVSTLQFSTGVLAGIIGAYIYMFVTSVLLRHYFCQYVCAPGLMQMLFAWVSPRSLGVRFDREHASRCTDCGQCERVCFMNVKPRAPRHNINCVNCGECISACRREIGGEGLFCFRFGGRAQQENRHAGTCPTTSGCSIRQVRG